MKAKRFLAALLLGVFVFTGVAFSAEVEDALTQCPEQSVYVVLKLNDTQNLLKWIFSKENIDIFMPLIIASKDSNEIIGVIEMISAFAENTPLNSVALLAGVYGEKNPVPFLKMAFTVKPEAEPFVKKIADGSAGAIDIAKLVLGKDNPLASFAESMIKVEKGEDNILRVDNELFVTAQDNMILMGLSADDIKTSKNALENPEARLFNENMPRRFAAKDFAWIHVDPKALDTLDEDDAINPEEIAKYLVKPINVEFGFMRVPGKFLASMATNLREALSKEYFDKTSLENFMVKTKGGYINFETSGGEKSPLFALGGKLNIEGLKITPEGQELWNAITKQLKNRFGISEEDFSKMFAGAFSLVVNDSITVEGIKIPAVYISQTGADGTAEKIFGILEKSPHLSKVQDSVLQVNTDVSPVSCLIKKDGEKLGINFAELQNISAKPELKPSLSELMNIEATSAMWIDFAEIQSWILDAENGVLAMVGPLAKFSGYGEIYDAAKEVLESKLSVPSMSVRSDTIEIIHTEFDIDEDVKAEEGLIAKLVNAAKKLMDSNKAEDKKTEENK